MTRGSDDDDRRARDAGGTTTRETRETGETGETDRSSGVHAERLPTTRDPRTRSERGTRASTARSRKTRAGGGANANEGALGALGESGRAMLALGGNVYVRSVEDKLPSGVRAVVRGARCEMRAVADALFAAAWATTVLATRVASAGAERAGREGTKALSAGARASGNLAAATAVRVKALTSETAVKTKDFALEAMEKAKSFTAVAATKTKTLAEGGRTRVVDGLAGIKTFDASGVAVSAKEKTREALRGVDAARQKTAESVKTLIDVIPRRLQSTEKTSKQSDEKRTRVVSQPQASRAVSREATSSNHREAPERLFPKPSSSKRELPLAPKISVADRFNALVPKETTQKLKERMKGFEEGVGSWPVVEFMKPKVKELVQAVAERQRDVVAKLQISTEGGVETLNKARSGISSEMVQHVRGVKTHIEGGIDGLKVAVASGVTSARERILKLPKRRPKEQPKQVGGGTLPRRIIAGNESQERNNVLRKEIDAASHRVYGEEELLTKPVRVVVQPRDNLFDLASIAGISVMDLARYNSLKPDPHTRMLKLHPGQVLYVPSQSLLDRLPAIDVSREPQYELSILVTEAPKKLGVKKQKRLVHPSRHSRHRDREMDTKDKSSNAFLTVTGSMALVACAIALRGVRREMEDDEN
ncbi:hypothetical protein BE221DRAFT_192303 [Ostreococcus tauri]|uniref:LysM domain-containing protein n=1 Tax=Ostreococcus tauri TaxID=70448 RepID=A0A1Y5ICE3_OSTTA|nr:hypothetical protein BE221DRAFT_192303 [Ostreococcus tauri]